VRYSELVDVGRAVAERRVRRPLAQRAARWVLREGLSRPGVFGSALAIGRLMRPLLPASLAAKVAPERALSVRGRRFVMPDACWYLPAACSRRSCRT
jgi:glycolate oxidase iron-sulfur subunit